MRIWYYTILDNNPHVKDVRGGRVRAPRQRRDGARGDIGEGVGEEGVGGAREDPAVPDDREVLGQRLGFGIARLRSRWRPR